MAVADVNNDGKLELVAGDARGNLATFTADGKEVWETHLESQIHNVGVMPGPARLSVAFCGCRAQPRLVVWLASFGGHINAATCAPLPCPPNTNKQNPVFGDVDGDGELELVVTTFRWGLAWLAID